jgi:hypothetical protein
MSYRFTVIEFKLVKRSKANRFGHILRGNCLPRHVTEGNTQGRIEVTGTRGRNRKQILDDLKEIRAYWILKEEAVDRSLCRTRCRRGPIVRQPACFITAAFKQPILLCARSVLALGYFIITTL